MSVRIDPKELARIKDLELAARIVAAGYRFGFHRGARRGTGVEFAEYRHYGPGDQARQVDWRVYARTEKFVVREAELETDARVWFILDTSASMDQRSEDGPLSKMAFARHLIAVLSYIACRQNDEFGLIQIGTDCDVRLAPGIGGQHWGQLLGVLESMKPGGRIESPPSLPQDALGAGGGTLLIVISDFYQETDEITGLIEGWTHPNREILACCLESSDERNFPYAGRVCFTALETGATIETAPASVRESYLNRREDYFAEIARTLQGRHVDFARFNIDEPMNGPLEFLLRERSRRNG